MGETLVFGSRFSSWPTGSDGVVRAVIVGTRTNASLASHRIRLVPVCSVSDPASEYQLRCRVMDGAKHEWGNELTPFLALGGEKRIRAIVERFYDIINAQAPVLRAMLPANDAVSRQKLYEYLVEWTGGDDLYSTHRGHPRMRMRHMPFAIGEDEVKSWLACMSEALDDNDVQGPVRGFLDDRFGALAIHMQNQP
jgi:hemoglobin